MHTPERLLGAWLSGGSGDEGGDDVGGVSVEADAGAVVAHGGARVGVAGGFLDVAEWDSGVERGSDEGVPERVRSDPLGEPRPAAIRRTRRAAAWRSSRTPSVPRKIGPS
jgi:hypothetical protein